LKWVWWFNHHRLLEPIGYLPPAEYEEEFYRRSGTQEAVAALT
jgi:putative transposase